MADTTTTHELLVTTFATANALAKLTADARRFNLKPGMAGWAWILGRNCLA